MLVCFLVQPKFATEASWVVLSLCFVGNFTSKVELKVSAEQVPGVLCSVQTSCSVTFLNECSCFCLLHNKAGAKGYNVYLWLAGCEKAETSVISHLSLLQALLHKAVLHNAGRKLRCVHCAPTLICSCQSCHVDHVSKRVLWYFFLWACYH